MKVFYLAGPMTGKDGFNYEQFDLWADRVRRTGLVDVINPADNYGRDQARPYADYISLAVKQVSEADGVYLLPLWHESRRGVYVELTVALALGLPVYELREDATALLGWVSAPLDMTAGIVMNQAFGTSYVCHLDGKAEPQGFRERLDDGVTSAQEFAEANREWLIQDGFISVKQARESEGLETKRRITDEAWGLVMGDREAAYGHPASDFKAMGRITGAILSRWLESESLVVVPKELVKEWPPEPVHFPDIDPRIVALIMTAVKISRLSAQHKHDSTTDLIGYAICEDRIAEGY